MTSGQIKEAHPPTRKQCLACKKKFTPDPRVGERQKYCSKAECQILRQRLNEDSWLKKEENQKFRAAQQRRWRKNNPEHLTQWREEHPESVRRNREFMREYKRREREDILFEKSKEWNLQVTRDKGVIYMCRGNTWILTRLKRAGRLSKAMDGWYAYGHVRLGLGSVRLPQGRLYKVTTDP
jgi:hypothetical protein